MVGGPWPKESATWYSLDMSEFLLTELRVAGWKSFRDVTINFGRLTVLIGANGAGKSNLLACFPLIRAVAERRLLDYWKKHGRAYQLFHYGPKRTDQIEIGWTLNEKPNFLRIKSSNDPGYASDSGSLSAGVYATGPSPETIFERAQKANEATREEISRIRLYHFNDTSMFSRIRDLADIHQTQYLHEDGGNLAAVLWQMRKDEAAHFKEIERQVRSGIPGFSHFELEPARGDRDEVRLEWIGAESDYPMTPHQLSDGSLRWIALCTLLMQPVNWRTGVILIDEPELGLHPALLERLAGLIHYTSQRNQIIIATQSPFLLNFFEPEHVITINHDGRESRVQRHDSESLRDWLEDYTMGELWEKNVLGGQPIG
jgi:predicted ATPase